MPIVKWHSREDNPQLIGLWLWRETALTFPGDGESRAEGDELLLKLYAVFVKTGYKNKIPISPCTVIFLSTSCSRPKLSRFHP
jgi:hypothetical protein